MPVFIRLPGLSRCFRCQTQERNKKVAFELEGSTGIQRGPNPCNWTTCYRSVMGKGSISIETGLEIKRYALNGIMNKYGWGNNELDYDNALLARLCILQIKIESLSGKQSGLWE